MVNVFGQFPQYPQQPSGAGTGTDDIQQAVKQLMAQQQQGGPPRDPTPEEEDQIKQTVTGMLQRKGMMSGQVQPQQPPTGIPQEEFTGPTQEMVGGPSPVPPTKVTSPEAPEENLEDYPDSNVDANDQQQEYNFEEAHRLAHQQTLDAEENARNQDRATSNRRLIELAQKFADRGDTENWLSPSGKESYAQLLRDVGSQAFMRDYAPQITQALGTGTFSRS